MNYGLEQVLNAGVEAISSGGAIGVGAYALVFLLATLLFVPASPLTALSGFLYGPLWGGVLVSLIGPVSATLAFSLGRTAARPRVRRWLQGRTRLAAIDRAVAHDGTRIVLLLRLASIIPFAPLNYVLGASRMPSRRFVLATALGLLPGNFVYAYLGSLVSEAGQILRGQLAEGAGAQVLGWISLAAALLAVGFIARVARSAIDDCLEQDVDSGDVAFAAKKAPRP